MIQKIGVVAMLCLLSWAILLGIKYNDPQRIGIESLIKELSSDNIEVADRAQRHLIDIGKTAIPFLEEHDNPQEAKINARIKAIFDAIEEAERNNPTGKTIIDLFREASPIATSLVFLLTAGIIVLISILITMKKKFGRFW